MQILLKYPPGTLDSDIPLEEEPSVSASDG
jgi:hypothetical protein